MSQQKIDINFDYVEKNSKVTVLSTASGVYYNIFLFDPDGVVMQTCSASPVDGNNFISTSTGFLNFDYPLKSYGTDTSIKSTDLSGVYYSDFYTNWQLSAENDILDIVLGIEVASSTNYNIPVDRRNEMYLGQIAMITRGDAVYQGTLTTVSGEVITLTTNKAVASYTGYNMANCIGKIISGAHSGQYFSTTTHTLGSSNIYVDQDLSSMTGELVALMPRREVTTYSGWYYTGQVGSLGEKGVKARFGFSENIPLRVGSMLHPTGYYSGVSVRHHPADPDGLSIPLTWNMSTIALSGDAYGRSIEFGDLIYFSPSGNLGQTKTGIAIYVEDHAVPAQGAVAVTYWPAAVPDPATTYTIHRANHFSLLNTLKFDTDYNVLAVPSSGDPIFDKVRTPSATISVTANEFESTFADVTETSNFYIGPITLSNGQVITDISSTLPYLHFSGSVYYGDPTAMSVAVTKQMNSTQHADIAHKYNGAYQTGGIFTITSPVGFTTAQTLLCEAEIAHGQAKVATIVAIPVQPV